MYWKDLIIVFIFVLHFADLSEPPGDPTVSCMKFVSEGESVTCDCEARFHDDHPSDFSLTWPGHSGTRSLSLPKVMRRDNGTVFTCLMIWNGHRRTASYTLQVAYGPDDSHTTIIGPRTFIADGTKSLTLTCRSTDVNPAPVYTWDTERCEKEDMVTGTCTFTPAPLRDDGRQLQCTAKSQAGGNNKGTATISLNLAYPPREPPVITGYTPGDVISRGSQLMCNISGGKPMVSKVIFTCETLTLQYTINIRSEVGIASSSLIIDDINGKNNSVLCTCRGLWEPQEDLYTLTSQILIHTQDNDDVKHNSSVGWSVGFLIGVLAGVAISFVVCYLRRKYPSWFRATNQNIQSEATKDHSSDPLAA